MKTNFSLKLGPAHYSVVLCSREEQESRCGVTFNLIGEMRISDRLSEGQQRITLLHEVMHAASHFVGMDDDKAKYTEEQFINRISATLLQALQDNADLRVQLGLPA